MSDSSETQSSESSDEEESTSSYRKRVRKVKLEHITTKKKIAEICKKIQEKRRSKVQKKKSRVIYSDSSFDDDKDYLNQRINIHNAKNIPPLDTRNMPSTSKSFHSNIYSSESNEDKSKLHSLLNIQAKDNLPPAQQYKPIMTSASSEASSNKAEASDTDDKDELHSKLQANNSLAQNLPLSKRLFNDFVWPNTAQDSSPPAVSTKRPCSNTLESGKQIRKKTDYRPRKVHPASAPPGEGWSERMNMYNHKAPRINKHKFSNSSAIERQTTQQSRIKFIKELKKVLEKR